jgi:hypothetical protein
MRSQPRENLSHLLLADTPAAAARRNGIVVASVDHAARISARNCAGLSRQRGVAAALACGGMDMIFEAITSHSAA